VELLFRWIKQQPRIKAFYCTSKNAVKTQAWVASRGNEVFSPIPDWSK